MNKLCQKSLAVDKKFLKIFFCILLPAFFSLIAYSQTNPVISGDWSDPAVLRVNSDYYSLRSTFGWQPGLQIVHSKDLVHWEYFASVYAGNDTIVKPGEIEVGVWGSDMGYNPKTGMYLVFAPLNFNIHVFYSPNAGGPYTDGGVLLKRRIDPGVFTDSDGTMYLTDVSGEIFQLTDDGLHIRGKVGQRPVVTGAAPGEGPEISRRGDYYYYYCSEGGTCPYEDHKILSFRAKSLSGPWEADPMNPLKHAPAATNSALQGPGHGELIETQKGEWYISYLIYELQYPSLGRQTCLEPITWTSDGWWRPVSGKIPPLTFKKPDLPQVKFKLAASDLFDKPVLGKQWVFHTNPDYSGKSWSLENKPGALRITSSGFIGESNNALKSLFLQRITLKTFEFSCKLDFNPVNDQDAAGIHVYSDTENFIMLALTFIEGKKMISVISKSGDLKNSGGLNKRNVLKSVACPSTKMRYLKIKVSDPETASFYYSENGKIWKSMEVNIPFGTNGQPNLGWRCGHWTGAMMGVFAEGKETMSSGFTYFDHFLVKPLKSKK